MLLHRRRRQQECTGAHAPPLPLVDAGHPGNPASDSALPPAGVAQQAAWTCTGCSIACYLLDDPTSWMTEHIKKTKVHFQLDHPQPATHLAAIKVPAPNL